MFTHVGMLTLTPVATEEDRTTIIDRLAGLVGEIDGLVRVKAGFDLDLSEGNADLLFLLEFDDEAAWQAYRAHPAHVAVIQESIAPVLKAKAFVQVAGIETVGERS